jgi:hypothetical protein
MARDVTITARELTPFEQLVLGLLCEGKSNAAIARETNHTEKVVERLRESKNPRKIILRGFLSI